MLYKLQSVQNSAVKLLKYKDNNVTLSTQSYLKKFHWLPIRARILFKILLLVRKCLNNRAPPGLTKLLNYSSSSRTVKLTHHRNKREYGDRAFISCGPKLWNLLPLKLRMEEDTNTFKKQLKTSLFDHSHELMRKVKER